MSGDGGGSPGQSWILTSFAFNTKPEVIFLLRSRNGGSLGWLSAWCRRLVVSVNNPTQASLGWGTRHPAVPTSGISPAMIAKAGSGRAMLNQQLYDVVREIYDEIIEDFKAAGVDLNGREFLSDFSYIFISPDSPARQSRVIEAAFSPQFRDEAELAIEAAFTDHHGGTTESYLCWAVDDFLNYIIPRIAGLPEQDAVFNEFYEQFDTSLYGKQCVITTFSILQNVWDNSLRAVLPIGYSLRYVSKSPTLGVPNRWTRERCVPYFEIARSARPTGLGRSIKDEFAYFVFSHSTSLPKNKRLMDAACNLRDDITQKFIFSVRLLKFSSAFSDYRGFRTLGHLSRYRMNLMNFPDDSIKGGVSRELQEHDGFRLRRLLPKLAGERYERIAVLDTKIEDALRRERPVYDSDMRSALKVAIDQLLDYCQMLEAVVDAKGSENIALYSAVLLSSINKHESSKAPNNYEFIKRMYRVRNEVMHGRVDNIYASNKNKFCPDDVQRFRNIVHALAGAYVMNGPLRESATKLALGQSVELTSLYPDSTEEINQMRRPHLHPPGW
jgi:uncharacterized protein YutE (UPF0331/DUF86 family)